MALAERLLVDADVSDRPRLFPRVAPRDGAAHHAPGCVPADARDLTRTFDRTALQDQVDDQPLQQPREAAPWLGPRHPHLLHAMGRTRHPRNLGMQMRLKLTRVEMAPRPLCRMIECGQRLAAVGTGPARRLVLQPDIDPLVPGLQLDARHVPGANLGIPKIVSNSLVSCICSSAGAFYQQDTSSAIRRRASSHPPGGPRRRPDASPGILATHGDPGRTYFFNISKRRRMDLGGCRRRPVRLPPCTAMPLLIGGVAVGLSAPRSYRRSPVVAVVWMPATSAPDRAGIQAEGRTL